MFGVKFDENNDDLRLLNFAINDYDFKVFNVKGGNAVGWGVVVKRKVKAVGCNRSETALFGGHD